MILHFKTSVKECTRCGGELRPYKTYRREIRSIGYGSVTAIHHVMYCPEHGKFRAEGLVNIVAPGCTYANDVMVEAAMLRFIDARSSSEISRQLDICISERHIANLSSMALQVHRVIHDDHSEEIRERMSGYILQIDGTVDSEFAMIVAVVDAVSGFILMAKRCGSESEEEMREVLEQIGERYGMPVTTMSDMRAVSYPP